ncbi:MAG: hypothetical protein K8L97_04670 [Anaerolineae bacterium]|nr:hypothetical protein [Anaerolineae bacterium]
MVDMEMVFKAVNQMTREEIHQLTTYIEQQKKTRWWVIPPDNLEKIAEVMRPVQEDAAHMTEEEINALIDEAIAEVRLERKQNQSRD